MSRKYFIFFFLYLFTNALLGQQKKQITVVVEPYKNVEFYEHFKRLVLKTEPTGIDFIENFDFEWGYRYTLEVESEELGSWLSDGTTHHYKLTKIISKETVDSNYEFSLYLDYHRYYYDEGDTSMAYTLKSDSDSNFVYFEEVMLEIPIRWMDAFKALKTSENGRIARFVFIKPNHLRLLGF
jgi:hypothetical protein